MKKAIRLLGCCLIVALLSSLLLGCSKPNKEEAFEILREAVELSSKKDIYYIKLLNVVKKDGNEDKYVETVNLYGETDDDGNPIYDENRAYPKGYKLNISAETYKNVSTKPLSHTVIQCGVPKNGGASLLTVTDKNDGKLLSQREISTYDYVQSEDFRPYSLKTRLSELSELTSEDVEFDYDGGGAEKKLFVYTINFRLKQEYITKYAASHDGKNSVFIGKTVTVEISYGRIQSIAVYQNDGEPLSVDWESYKLSISYLGPKFDIG